MLRKCSRSTATDRHADEGSRFHCANRALQQFNRNFDLIACLRLCEYTQSLGKKTVPAVKRICRGGGCEMSAPFRRASKSAYVNV